mmetsp:Transcript_74352/g.177378  ORF Transcript_74352/g.177378 Transcript_74352/m.177378 type:complete len:95 (+) Transcript_74352:192-476(+)
MRPLCKTKISSLERMVERRCATVMVVFPTRASCMACCTSFSEVESSAEVASSSSISWGRRSRARAMAQRCFCPPLSFSPRRPTRSLHFTAPEKT